MLQSTVQHLLYNGTHSYTPIPLVRRRDTILSEAAQQSGGADDPVGGCPIALFSAAKARRGLLARVHPEACCVSSLDIEVYIHEWLLQRRVETGRSAIAIGRDGRMAIVAIGESRRRRL